MPDTRKMPVPSGPANSDLNLINRKLGDFHVLRRLGQGGMGDVYLAEQDSLKRPVALKVLKPSLAGDKNYVQRFFQEARAAAKLVHANIVQIYEVGERDGIYYISQEYVAGGNLRQRLAVNGRPLDPAITLFVLMQVLSALQKAGDLGIVHRDIKPENIMLTPAGEVKVADFGLARISGDREALQLTQTGMTMGSPLYMSPEQAEGKPVDPRSDLYSLGATAFHMLTGRPPFEGDTSLAVAWQHVKSSPPPLHELRGDIPPALCQLIARLLAKQPDDRFANAAEVLKSLHQMRGEIVTDEHTAIWQNWLLASQPIPLGSSRFAATEKLEHIMRTQSLRTPHAVAWRTFALAAAIAFFAGCFLAGISRPKTLLPAPQRDTAGAQR